MRTWQEWLAAERAKGTMSAEVVALTNVQGWDMQQGGAWFGRPDGKFFDVIGVRITNAGREVQIWDQPMVRETGAPGAVVLVKAKDTERYLVSARAEPGTDRQGCILLGPTLQASSANLAQVHGGKRPPHADILDTYAPNWVQLHQDGGRNFQKVNQHAVVVIEDKDEIAIGPNERWFTHEELADAIRAGEANEHLIQVFCLALV